MALHTTIRSRAHRSAGGLFRIDPVEARKQAVMETAVRTAVHSTGEHTEKNLPWALELPKQTS